MPNWKTHLEIGKRIAKRLNYQDEEMNLFLLGNILPDINNCYIVKNISTQLGHHYTHYSDDETPSYIRFENEFKNYIPKNVLIFGYFTHLYTDYIWNDDFYTKVAQRGMNTISHDILRIMKQADFQRYNNEFCENNSIQISDLNKALLEIQKIDRVSITRADIEEVIHFLNAQKSDGDYHFEFYQKEELDILLEKTVRNVLTFAQK